jgi:hypothetical protein
MLRIVENSRPGWMPATVDPPGGATTRSSILALADQVVVSAVNFLTGVIIGRACRKEEFGLYMLGFSIVFVVTTLQNSLILTPYMIFSPRLQGRAHAKYAGSTLVHQLGLSVLTMLALTAGGLLLELGIGPEELAPVLWALVGVVAFVLSRDCARQICFARLRMEMAFLLDCCVAVVQIAGLGLLAYFHLLSASAAWWMAGAASCLATLGWLLWMRENLVVRITAVLADLRRNWSFGKWVFASGVAWALTMYLYPWILVGFHGNASAGSWAACLGIIGITNPIAVVRRLVPFAADFVLGLPPADYLAASRSDAGDCRGRLRAAGPLEYRRLGLPRRLAHESFHVPVAHHLLAAAPRRRPAPGRLARSRRGLGRPRGREVVGRGHASAQRLPAHLL